ncbi:hypothetical protein J132_04944 [Termitomyces sp. J132]|nr:hypothetical protein J132_04944 [Termitomyces sp. J132]
MALGSIGAHHWGSGTSPRDVEQAAEMLEQVVEIGNGRELTGIDSITNTLSSTSTIPSDCASSTSVPDTQSPAWPPSMLDKAIDLSNPCHPFHHLFLKSRKNPGLIYHPIKKSSAIQAQAQSQSLSHPVSLVWQSFFSLAQSDEKWMDVENPLFDDPDLRGMTFEPDWFNNIPPLFHAEESGSDEEHLPPHFIASNNRSDSGGATDDSRLPPLFIAMDDKSNNGDRADSGGELDDGRLPPLFMAMDDKSDKEVISDNGNVLRVNSLPPLFIALDAGSKSRTSTAGSGEYVPANITYIHIADQHAREIPPPSSFHQEYHQILQ